MKTESKFMGLTDGIVGVINSPLSLIHSILCTLPLADRVNAVEIITEYLELTLINGYVTS